jgi:hypothetical protein
VEEDVKRKRVGILVFPDVEVLDFCGPYEVFSVTRLSEERRRGEPSPFEVFLLAERAEPVVATGGLRVLPDVTLETRLAPESYGARVHGDRRELPTNPSPMATGGRPLHPASAPGSGVVAHRPANVHLSQRADVRNVTTLARSAYSGAAWERDVSLHL